MVLAVARHAESIENADKYNGFYHDRRPYSGKAAHEISKNVVGLTPRGFRQALWLRDALTDLSGPRLHVYTSSYRRAIDTTAIAFPHLPDGWPRQTNLLDEQHYGDATYMTKEELFATYPDGADDRRLRKHLWVPPCGEGEERPAGRSVTGSAPAFLPGLPGQSGVTGPEHGPGSPSIGSGRRHGLDNEKNHAGHSHDDDHQPGR